jgi:hypothetical protein
MPVVVHCATPPTRVSTKTFPAHDRFGTLNWNATAPVGTEAPGGCSVTVAVNVTDCPEAGVATDEERAVAVGLGEAPAAEAVATQKAAAKIGTKALPAHRPTVDIFGCSFIAAWRQ